MKLHERPGVSPRRRVLVVDDEGSVRRLIARYLSAEGFDTEEAADTPQAFEALGRFSPDLVLLDVVLPGEDGLDFLARVRRTSDVPVILLTAKGDEPDRIIGLKLGADDYVVKPFSPPELAARVNSVLRRATGSRPPLLEMGDGLSIDLAARKVLVGQRPVALRAREFDLLSFLARSPRQVFSREQLLDQVWGASGDWQDPRTVNEHVRRIRHHIEAEPDNPRWVKTVRGVGYYLEP
jgi:two-component system, OmpR family, phosphate regulon response regulator PhoB